MTVQEISDRLEINDLLVRYTVALDTGQWDLLDSCFTADAHIDYKSSGGIEGAYPEVKEWLSKVLPTFSAMMHIISNSTVDLNGDRAAAKTYVLNPMQMRSKDASVTEFTVGAYYHDKLLRTDEGWRIEERVEEQVMVIGNSGGSPS
ncbi:MAG: nuclear transport factor 2 family protein [Deltaproteobacteria bacterium]